MESSSVVHGRGCRSRGVGHHRTRQSALNCRLATSSAAVGSSSRTLGAEANFGAHGGCKNGAFWGTCQLRRSRQFLETTPYRVSSTEITGYLDSEPNVREICGIAQTNADEEPVYFRVKMVHGESGSPDKFGIIFPTAIRSPCVFLAMEALVAGSSSSINRILPTRGRIRLSTKPRCARTCRHPGRGRRRGEPD